MQNMNDFDKLSSIWNQQKPAEPVDANALITKARKTQRNYNSKVLINIIALLLSLVAIIWILFVIRFKSYTTYIGIAFLSIAIISFTALRFWHYIRFAKIKLTGDPVKTLQQLEKIVQFQKHTQTRLIPIYFLLISLGLILYYIEVIAPFSATTQALIYLVTFSWFLIAYFILGKKQARKEDERLQSIIDSIKRIETGLRKES